MLGKGRERRSRQKGQAGGRESGNEGARVWKRQPSALKQHEIGLETQAEFRPGVHKLWPGGRVGPLPVFIQLESQTHFLFHF